MRHDPRLGGVLCRDDKHRETAGYGWAFGSCPASLANAAIFNHKNHVQISILGLNCAAGALSRSGCVISATTYPPVRSEEHTSELQSLMRISYAVFCLKNKHKNKNTS